MYPAKALISFFFNFLEGCGGKHKLYKRKLQYSNPPETTKHSISRVNYSHSQGAKSNLGCIQKQNHKIKSMCFPHVCGERIID